MPLNNKNDLYTPILPFRFIFEITFKVYNRWGNLVFETNDPDINWNGKDMNNETLLNTGFYFYSCEIYEKKLEGVIQRSDHLKGWIHLIR